MITPYRGEIWLCELGTVVGSEQGKTRPCVILQNDVGNLYAPTTIIAPLTTTTKSLYLPTHVKISYNHSVVMLEQIRTIDKQRLIKKLSFVSRYEQIDINIAIKNSIL